MSTDAPAATETPAASWPALGLHERRVLGVLVEKAKTTPDVYPLSLNALVTGCNQKSNREPVLSLIDAEVEEAVGTLKKAGYVQQIMGSGRVDKFKHTLYETLKVDKVQLAILAELFLRGPQTEGELRGRASRMEPISELDLLRTHLQQLAQRGLVVYLSPEGRRGTVVTHGFHSAGELAQLRSSAGRETTAAAVPTTSSSSAGVHQRIEALEQEIADLRGMIASIQSTLASLGPPPPGGGSSAAV